MCHYRGTSFRPGLIADCSTYDCTNISTYLHAGELYLYHYGYIVTEPLWWYHIWDLFLKSAKPSSSTVAYPSATTRLNKWLLPFDVRLESLCGRPWMASVSWARIVEGLAGELSSGWHQRLGNAWSMAEYDTAPYPGVYKKNGTFR